MTRRTLIRNGAISEKKRRLNNKRNGPAKSFNAILQSNRKRPAYSITHIGIFAALLQFRTAAGYINPIKAYRHEIMKIAKISGPVTCHRCTGDLNDYGYINYLPKRNRIRRASFISPFKSLLQFSVKDSKAVFMRNLGSLSHEQLFFLPQKV